MSVLFSNIKMHTWLFINILFLYFALFNWYYTFSYNILKLIIGENSIFIFFNSSFNLILYFTILLCGKLIKKAEKTTFIFIWTIISLLSQIFFIMNLNTLFKLIVYLFSGFIFGLSILSYFAYFWEFTTIEERGRISGFMGLINLPIFSIITLLIMDLRMFKIIILCVIFNLIVLIILLKLKEKRLSIYKTTQKGFNPEKRVIILYLIPWIIFSFINVTLAKIINLNVWSHFPCIYTSLLIIIQLIGSSLGALIGGIIADLFGRRLSITFGLTFYGISTAISGLSKSYITFLLAFLGNGISWGIFLTLYLFVIWGDLSNEETFVHRYSIGLGIPFLANGVGIFFNSQVYNIPLLYATLIICLLIFISNIPLIMAPELLPSDFRERIHLKLYLYFVKLRKRRFS